MNAAIPEIESNLLAKASRDVSEDATIEAWVRHAAARSGFGAPEATMRENDQAGGAGTNM